MQKTKIPTLPVKDIKTADHQKVNKNGFILILTIAEERESQCWLLRFLRQKED